MRLAIALFVLLLAATAPARAGVVLSDSHAAHLAGLLHLEGAPLKADSLQGKAVVLAFFASWCPPCEPEFVHLKEAYTHFPTDDLTIVAVNVFEDWAGENPARLRRFLARHAPPYSVVEGGPETRALFGQVERIPTVFVFDREGEPILHFIHAQGAEKRLIDRDELFAAIEAAF